MTKFSLGNKYTFSVKKIFFIFLIGFKKIISNGTISYNCKNSSLTLQKLKLSYISSTKKVNSPYQKTLNSHYKKKIVTKKYVDEIKKIAKSAAKKYIMMCNVYCLLFEITTYEAHTLL
jgi:hypothetical protein